MPPPSMLSLLRGGDPLVSRVQDQLAGTLNPLLQAIASTPMLGAAPPPWVNLDILGGFTQLSVPGVLSAAAAYHQNALGYVYTRGFILNSSGGPLAGVTAMVFPKGTRPNVSFIVPASAQGTIAGTGYNVTVTDAGLFIPDPIPHGDSLSWYFSFLGEQ